MVVAVPILSAVMTEFIFDCVTGRTNTLRDGSAVVTGLLPALCLPALVPLYRRFVRNPVCVYRGRRHCHWRGLYGDRPGDKPVTSKGHCCSAF